MVLCISTCLDGLMIIIVMFWLSAIWQHWWASRFEPCHAPLLPYSMSTSFSTIHYVTLLLIAHSSNSHPLDACWSAWNWKRLALQFCSKTWLLSPFQSWRVKEQPYISNRSSFQLVIVQHWTIWVMIQYELEFESSITLHILAMPFDFMSCSEISFLISHLDTGNECQGSCSSALCFFPSQCHDIFLSQKLWHMSC